MFEREHYSRSSHKFLDLMDDLRRLSLEAHLHLSLNIPKFEFECKPDGSKIFLSIDTRQYHSQIPV